MYIENKVDIDVRIKHFIYKNFQKIKRETKISQIQKFNITYDEYIYSKEEIMQIVQLFSKFESIRNLELCLNLDVIKY